MTDAEYRAGMDALSGAVRTLRLLPLKELDDALHGVESMAPYLDPTAFRDGGAKRLAAQRRLIDAALRLQAVADDIAPKLAAALTEGA